MKRILLNGVDGNFGFRAADVLLEKWPHEDLIFTAPTEDGTKRYADSDVELRVANYNDPDGLANTFSGVDAVILISMPFVGPRRRTAHKNAVDAAVAAGVDKLVYTSIVCAGEDDIGEYLAIASEVTGKKVTYEYIDDDALYAFFDSIGVPRTTEGMWAASPSPCARSSSTWTSTSSARARPRRARGTVPRGGARFATD